MPRTFVLLTALALALHTPQLPAQSASDDRILAILDLGAGTLVGIDANNLVALVNGYPRQS